MLLLHRRESVDTTVRKRDASAHVSLRGIAVVVGHHGCGVVLQVGGGYGRHEVWLDLNLVVVL